MDGRIDPPIIKPSDKAPRTKPMSARHLLIFSLGADRFEPSVPIHHAVLSIETRDSTTTDRLTPTPLLLTQATERPPLEHE